jgi:putative restriction endonuclease
MAKSTGWTRDQLVLALRLYLRTPFGKLHRLNPEIIELAAKIGRTPAALAMKACNFASIDPNLDRKGLSGSSQADRKVWAEFAANPESLAAEVEEAVERLQVKSHEHEHPVKTPTGETEIERVIRARRVQSFFRDAVLVTYHHRCAITGIALPELLVACHIIPWSDSIERRADPTNGLCLNALFDRAFDRGLMSLDKDFRVITAKRLVNACTNLELKCSILEAEGRQIELPQRFPPDPVALEYHRTRIFSRRRDG